MVPSRERVGTARSGALEVKARREMLRRLRADGPASTERVLVQGAPPWDGQARRPPLSHSQFCQEMSRECALHGRKRGELEARLEAFQAMCKHKQTRFQDDPAGGNGSRIICAICDKVLR